MMKSEPSPLRRFPCHTFNLHLAAAIVKSKISMRGMMVVVVHYVEACSCWRAAGARGGPCAHANLTLRRRALSMTKSSMRMDLRCGLRVIDFQARTMRRSMYFETEMLCLGQFDARS